METKLKAIFLHGMWRAGTTYVWSRFRDVPDCYCFYEPLHHGLARITKDRIVRDTRDITQQNTHPDLAQPYFREFEPLINGRGVVGFQKDMAYDRFVLARDDRHDALRSYIAELVDYAHAHGKVPVLGFNRTVMRLPWIAENFDALNVYIDRDPREIWWSYERHRQKGNNTFFTAWLRVIDHNREESPFASLAHYLGMKARFLRLDDKAYYKKILQTLTPEQTYHMVYAVWRASETQARQHAGFIFDMRRADDAAHQSEVAAACGVPVDFSDAARVPLSPEAQSAVDYAAIESRVSEIFQ